MMSIKQQLKVKEKFEIESSVLFGKLHKKLIKQQLKISNQFWCDWNRC